MKVIILAAGYATRLHPLTETIPKPLLPVAGKPIVEHILDKLEPIDIISAIYIVTNAKFYSAFQKWLAVRKPGSAIEIINDGTTSNDDRKGAVGDIHHVIQEKKIDDDMLVIAGDNLFEVSLKELIDDFKQKHHNALVLYDVKSKELASHYGVVEVENNIVTHFVEKPPEPKSTLISTGIYLFRKHAVELLEQYIAAGHSSDKTGEFIEWLHTQEDIYAFVTDDTWYDIGSIEQLSNADKHYQARITK